MNKKENVKKNIIDFSKIVIFLSICGVLLWCITPIFVPKNNTKKSGIKYENARGFYGERHNSIDIFALGNSDLYSAMNPLNYGIVMVTRLTFVLNLHKIYFLHIIY